MREAARARRRPAGQKRPPSRVDASPAACESAACWSGRWRCGAKRSGRSTSHPITPAVQSIGSSELTRTRKSPRTRRQAGEQIAQAASAGQIASPCPEVHAGQRDLLVAGSHDAAQLVEDVGERAAAARTAGSRDDAVAARLVAAGLRAQRPRGAAHQAGAGQPAARAIAARARPASEQRQEPRLVVVRHDLGHAGERRDLARRSARRSSRSRRSAPPGFSRWIRRMVWRAPWSALAVTEQVLTRTTSAQSGGTATAPALGQSGLDGQRIGLIDAAAERHDCVAHGLRAGRRGPAARCRCGTARPWNERRRAAS